VVGRFFASILLFPNGWLSLGFLGLAQSLCRNFQFTQMVFNQINYRFSGNYTHIDAVDFTRFFQQIAEVISHGTYKVNGHFFVVFVLPNMNVDEFTEAIVNEIAHPFFVAVIA
jgi:hypothetical protein